MPSFGVMKTMARELMATERSARITEPDLVMDDPAKVAAYTRAGREDGVMAPVYLFHCAQICEVIKPGDIVLDLACGPATQLAQVARLNPDINFIGIDLSEPMLQRAENHIRDLGLSNVSFRDGDISKLTSFEDASVDAVMSTMALHHLPDVENLNRTFSEIARVLRQDGGLYLVDFGHLKSERSIEYFAYQYADRQPELFTLDYLYSLRAAFSLSDFREAADVLAGRGKLYRTFAFPFMVAIKSRRRRTQDHELRKTLARMRSELPDYHKKDLKDLVSFFRLGGLRSSFFS